ncbi:protein kinase domain-containing protein [Roseofilum casamattae]|uniref:Lipopolysaccharide kinase InaA family protein n=1 Tax=Roseofilum casamattae BLCC-M143 TaxID=3022442 RepID=A0ABT7BUT6_9CYAN|nr:lipopolysaccharide kinase InaA family protein [Roseofilum casamattae]MDJ1182952.1 lipopolysaccharide kinase InaA family protein [Roseofilum casamattae BLCC-M143]
MATATLADGSSLEYIPDLIGEGAMKEVYFTADKSSVICFYKDPNAGSDPDRHKRLDYILTQYNPTLDPDTGDYFQQLFCWLTAIVVQPRLGIVTPAYPANYFFSSGNFTGKEKESTWFVSSKLRSILPEDERGLWINYFQICLRLTRAIRRMHSAGLAHSDLSNKNVLIDPKQGQCLVIDIDSLVVPDLFPPDVLGTRGYIAPDVLSTLHLPLDNPNRKHPCVATDQHALAVLLYQYLTSRHPLQGPKTYPAASGEEQERLEMGKKALFIEHPTDTSNQPKDLQFSSYRLLGSDLSKLFQRAFIQGLHSPNERPTAREWEKALVKTWDLFYPCANNFCSSHWFILHDRDRVECPFCGSKPKGTIPILRLRKQSRPGQWTLDGKLVVYHNLYLFQWHAFDNIFPGETADKTPQAYFVFFQDKWLLINQNLTSLTSPAGHPVAPSPELGKPGQAIELKEGITFQLSQEPHGRMVEVEMLKLS